MCGGWRESGRSAALRRWSFGVGRSRASTRPRGRAMSEVALEPRRIPVGAVGRSSVGYWGLLAFIVSEATLFGYLIFSYTYIAVQLEPAAAAQARLSFGFSVPMTIVVIVSS